MRLNEKRYAIFRALEMQKQTGRPSLTVTTTPTVSLSSMTDHEPFNKSNRPTKRPMEEAEKLEIHKRTGSSPYLEVMFR